MKICVTLNNVDRGADVETRLTLADFLRDECGLTGTHLGCEQGICGACTVIFDGRPVRSCLMFAVQASGHSVRTIEGVAEPDGSLDPIQQAFVDRHAFQCGFCTPGMVLTALALRETGERLTVAELRQNLSGNLCRCTGYVSIIAAVRDALGEQVRD